MKRKISKSEVLKVEKQWKKETKRVEKKNKK